MMNMTSLFRKPGIPAPFIMFSLMAHFILFGGLLKSVGPFDFHPPLLPLPAVSVFLTECERKQPRCAAQSKSEKRTNKPGLPRTAAGITVSDPITPGIIEARGETPSAATKENSILQAAPSSTDDTLSAADTTEVKTAIAVPGKNPVTKSAGFIVPVAVDYSNFPGPVRKGTEFLAASREKLTYRITLLKIPVGSAVIEASNKDGGFRITVRIASNGVISGFYPVDDLVETRMINGNYLLTRVRQNEGSYRSDFGFTLMLREHKAFWVDRLANHFNYKPLPDDDVMDVVSGFYFLRNRDLKVGEPVHLNLFDGNAFSTSTIEVLRREPVKLTGLEQKATLVVRPELPADGIFKRNRDVLIWLTDDGCKIPVKMECATHIGRVTAELISSEIQPASSPQIPEFSGRVNSPD